MFREVVNAYVILVRDGVYTVASAYIYGIHIYAQLSKNRYVALKRDHYTSNPKTMWKEIVGVAYGINQKSGAITVE